MTGKKETLLLLIDSLITTGQENTLLLRVVGH